MKTKYDLLVYGCGGHARSVIDVLVQDKPDILLCMIDEQAKEGEVIAGFPVFREEKEGDHFFLAIGDNFKRAEKYGYMHGRQPISIISKTSHIGGNAAISRGVFVGNFVHIGPESVIGLNSIINNGAVVDHEIQIGAHCHVGPNATISGRSMLGDFVFVGAGATIIDSITVCSDVTIGAGSVVVKNISEPGVYVGCPAKKIKK